MAELTDNEIDVLLAGITQGEWVASGNGIHQGMNCVAITETLNERYLANAKFLTAAPAIVRQLRKRESTLEKALVNQRRELGAAHDATIDELGRVRLAARGEIYKLQERVAQQEREIARLTSEIKEPRCNECGAVLGDNWCADCAGKADREKIAQQEREIEELRECDKCDLCEDHHY